MKFINKIKYPELLVPKNKFTELNKGQTIFTYNGTILMFILFTGCGQKKESATNGNIQFTGRSLVHSGEDWKVGNNTLNWKAEETAMIICDMWDDHWCRSMASRTAEMAPKINELAQLARENGVTIIHSPSNNMDFYEGTPQRNRMKNIKIADWAMDMPGWYHLDPEKEGEFPIDDSDEGCDDQPQCKDVNKKVWIRQIADIHIHPEDGISDSGSEILSYFEQEGIKNVIMTGVATNMCILGRSFGIRSLTGAGMSVVLTRDLTDTMYNPQMPPFVSHDEGTQLVVEHIEIYWCPSVLSKDLVQNGE